MGFLGGGLNFARRAYFGARAGVGGLWWWGGVSWVRNCVFLRTLVHIRILRPADFYKCGRLLPYVAYHVGGVAGSQGPWVEVYRGSQF